MSGGTRRALCGLGWCLALFLVAGCQPTPGPVSGELEADDRAAVVYLTFIAELTPAGLGGGERLRVFATTSIVGDVVAQVGGEAIELTVLLPPGSDPHGYSATPRELADISSADLLFVSGFDLEEGLGGVLEQVAVEVPVISISEGLAGRPMTEEAHDHEGEDTGGAEQDHQDEEGGIDPHVWFDPTIVMQWARNAGQALGARDPSHQATFQANAERYVQALDRRIEAELAGLPPGQRVLVSDHFVFGYFADRYGFEVVGAVIPAYSSSASASPQDLAALQQTIQEHGVKAVFVGASASPGAAEALARDAGIVVVRLYTESLSEAGGPATTYIAMMEYNVQAIVEALR
jgi:ABC-type Zn uptake system ZnuABC Zn-binding protein ZnuA